MVAYTGTEQGDSSVPISNGSTIWRAAIGRFRLDTSRANGFVYTAAENGVVIAPTIKRRASVEV